VKPVTDLILVTGGRRTGTTLLTAVLTSDSSTNQLGPEAQIVTRLIEAYRWGRRNYDDFVAGLVGELTTYTAFYADAAQRLVLTIRSQLGNVATLVLKNPEFARILADVAILIPDARVVVTVRDPRDQVASEIEVGMRRKAAGGAAPLAERRDVDRMTAFYVDYYTDVLEVAAARPDDVHFVRYEDLVLDTATTVARLRRFTGLSLPFDPTAPWPRVSDHLAEAAGSPSFSDLYGGPVSDRSIGRHLRDLSASEARRVAARSADFSDRFGYAQ